VSTARPLPKVRIALRASAEVDHPDVSLGDIATLTTDDLPTLRRLVDLPLGRVPRTGGAARVDRGTLVQWIHARTGIGPSEVEWSGPSVSEVRVALRDVSGEAIAQAAEESLRAALAHEGRRVELRVRQLPRPVSAPAGRLRLATRPIPRTAVVPRRLSAWVDVWVDESFVRTVPVDFDVGVFGPAYVAARDQRVGELLEPSTLAVREVEWSGRDAPPLDPASTDSSTRLRVRHAVSAGDALTRALVEPAPLVTGGGSALLRAGAEGIRLESRVEVLQDGRAGETVRVKLPNASGEILARVVGPGIVEVQP
jgi:flagella basal body P-ring formation protein FlgA